MMDALEGFLRGGRKWRGFVILCLLLLVFVLAGYIKSEVIIRDVMLGLATALGLFTAAEKFSPGKAKEPIKENAP